MSNPENIAAEPGSLKFSAMDCPRWQFEPKEDITAFELATLIPFFHGRAMTESEFADLGTAQRHFEVTNPLRA